jgi:hypothetical protein
LKINPHHNKSYFNVLNSNLILTFENVGHINEIGKNINNNNVSLFPIFTVSENDYESVDLVYKNGPPHGTKFNLQGINYYFIDRLSDELFNNSSISIMNHDSRVTNISVSKVNINGTLYYQYSPPLLSNGYLQLQIKFNSDLSQNTKYAVFLDDATTVNSNIWYYYGNNFESNETFNWEVYAEDIPTDNVFIFTTL